MIFYYHLILFALIGFTIIEKAAMMASWFPLTDEIDFNGIRIYRDKDNLLHCGGLVCKQATYCFVTQKQNYPERNVLTTFERCADLYNNTISERSFTSDSQELFDINDDTILEYGYVLSANGTRTSGNSSNGKRKLRRRL